MTSEQALQILKQYADLAPVPLQGHIQVQEAFKVLQSAIAASVDNADT